MKRVGDGRLFVVAKMTLSFFLSGVNVVPYGV